MFSQVTKNIKDFDNELDNKMSKRGDGIFKMPNSIEDVKENNLTVELNKAKNNVESEIEARRRLKKTNTKAIEYSKSLFDNLTISKEAFEVANKSVPNINELDNYVNNLQNSNNINDQYIGLVCIRKILSSKSNSPIQEIIDKGLVFILINLLNHKFPEFVYEATYSLTCICSGTQDQSNTVVIKGGAKRFIQLCDAEYVEIQEQAILGLANLAGDGINLRDKLIVLGALEKIKKYMTITDSNNLIKSCLHALSSFCNASPPPPCNIMEPVSITLIQLNIKI